MKHLLRTLIAVVLLISPGTVTGQARNSVVHIYTTSDQKLVSGRLVGVADSTLTVIRKPGSSDTVQVCCKSIYSIKQGRPLAEGIGTGLLNGVFLTLMVADNQRAATSASAGHPEAGSAYYDALAGGLGYLVMESNARKEPIIINYSYERFRAFAPELMSILDDSQ